MRRVRQLYSDDASVIYRTNRVDRCLQTETNVFQGFALTRKTSI